jgi:hypothetical protein
MQISQKEVNRRDSTHRRVAESAEMIYFYLSAYPPKTMAD